MIAGEGVTPSMLLGKRMDGPIDPEGFAAPVDNRRNVLRTLGDIYRR
jgi:hypothetical protein